MYYMLNAKLPGPQVNKLNFPHLYCIAVNVLPVQASAVIIEQMFSPSKETDTFWCNCLNQSLMEALQVLLQAGTPWLHTGSCSMCWGLYCQCTCHWGCICWAEQGYLYLNQQCSIQGMTHVYSTIPMFVSYLLLECTQAPSWHTTCKSNLELASSDLVNELK